MLKYNNKVLKVQDKWLNPNSAPVPLQDWYTLGEWAYDKFEFIDYSRYHVENTYICTDDSATRPTSGYAEIYKDSIYIPEERRNDNYLLLEIPMRAFRTSNISHYITDNPNRFSNIAVKLRRKSTDSTWSPIYTSLTNCDCKVNTEALTTMFDDKPWTQYYKPETWTHKMSAITSPDNNDLTLISTASNVLEEEEATRKLRIIYNLQSAWDDNHPKAYIQWGTNLPQEISLSDYTECYLNYRLGGYPNDDNYYQIGIYADGYGFANSDDYEWLFSGYWADYNDCKITLKSYKGAL